MRIILSALCVFLSLSTSLFSAQIPDTDTIPELLEPWKSWVLHGEEEKFCPTSYNNGDTYRCAWPSRLDLDLDQRSGRFTQKWNVFIKGRHALPGGQKQWPLNVTVDGKTVPVLEKDNSPAVYLMPGGHSVEGIFVWDEMPEMVHIPNTCGLVNLTINEKRIDFPLLDAQGQLWLQKREKEAQPEKMDVRIFRMISDTIPMQITTHLKINVSGRSREISIEGILFNGFIPFAVSSPLPARFDPEGRLQIQARPGRWEIRVQTRSEAPVRQITPDALAYGEETWAFQSQNHLRMVKIEGLLPVDPSQTELPREWKKYPTFIVKSGDQMIFKEIRRGDPDPSPDQIRLKRAWWLDFDGNGFTIQDSISGTMSRQWNLAMNPPAILGRVSVDGRDQLITFQGKDKKHGIELRKGTLNLISESRFEASICNIPAVGWDHDFQSVKGVLNLPPGWRLLTADGVDVMPGTWFSSWTLLDLFLVLIISLSITKLWNWRWGVLALITVSLIYHEPGAPQIVWLNLMAAIALMRVLPQGWIKRLISIWFLVSSISLIIIALPFMVHQARWAIYPQLEPVPPRGMPLQGMLGTTLTAEMASAPRTKSATTKMDVLRSYADGEIANEKEGIYQQRALMIQDPNAQIQTGPGLPDWQWQSYHMQWNGPVDSRQQIKLWLLSPKVNFCLGFLRVILLALLAYRILTFKKWKAPEGSFIFSAIVVCMLLIPGAVLGETHFKSFPSNEMLQKLKTRLTEKPDCLPACADSPQMKLTAMQDRIEILFKIHAAVETAVPLPGSLESWRPEKVLLDNSPAKGLMRDADGTLWILVPEGIHTALLQGIAPVGNAFQIMLPLKPQQVIVESDGWDIQGVGKAGRVEGGIRLTRLQKETEADGYSIQPAGTLPPFLHVERILVLGLNWQVWTTVKRITAVGTPVVVSVPLITGESVTTAGINVEDQKVKINMGPMEKTVQWVSSLNPEKIIKLKAPRSVPWAETWLMDTSPIWHCEFSGIPVVHHQDPSGQWRPRWQPWPGEEVIVSVSRPMAINGRSVTLDSVKLTLTPGKRFDKANLTANVRSSQGGRHKITLPDNAELQWIKIDSRTQPIRPQLNDLLIPLHPGTQTIEIQWHQNSTSAILTRTPKVMIGEMAVNAEVTFEMPRRWVLFAKGPTLGPAVLFWSYLLVVVIGAMALGRIPWTPLKTRQWLLLGLGLTQVPPIMAILIAGWLLVLGLRERHPVSGTPLLFNAGQILLICWTFAAMIGLYLAIEKGLLGIPDMQISGNGSSVFQLHWTQDRINAFMPDASVLSFPMFAYSFLMLGWALWLAYSLLKWLRWGWACFSKDGFWKKSEVLKQKKSDIAIPPAIDD